MKSIDCRVRTLNLSSVVIIDSCALRKVFKIEVNFISYKTGMIASTTISYMYEAAIESYDTVDEKEATYQI